MSNLENYKKVDGIVINDGDADYENYIRQRNILNGKTQDIAELRNIVSSLEHRIITLEQLLKVEQ